MNLAAELAGLTALVRRLQEEIDNHLAEIECTDDYHLADEMRSDVDPIIAAIKRRLAVAGRHVREAEEQHMLARRSGNG